MSLAHLTTLSLPMPFGNAQQLLSQTEIKKGDYKDGDVLAQLLRSDIPLNRGERALLAQLVTGELQRPRGRQQVGVGLNRIVRTVRYFNKRRKLGDPEKVALHKAQKFFKRVYGKTVKDSQLREWIAETKKRKSAHQLSKAKYSKPRDKITKIPSKRKAPSIKTKHRHSYRYP